MAGTDPEMTELKPAAFPSQNFKFPEGAAIRLSGQYCSLLLLLHNSDEDAMGSTYKSITSPVGTDLQTPTSKLEWEISQ